MADVPILLGHRGARSVRSVPENSIVSFDLALEHGCDGVEFDLRSTACGRIVACHDPKVGNINIARANCRQLVHLPRFEDILRHYGHRTFLDIELKVAGMESRVLAALRDRPRDNTYVVSSFLPAVIMELKARSAVVPTGIICQRSAQLARWRELPVDYVIVHRSLLTQRLVRLVHDAGRKLLVWTVNDSPSMLRFSNWGVDGIISDKTKLLAGTLKGPH
jgi:glycerophosphoryl diester phosphodiesterase